MVLTDADVEPWLWVPARALHIIGVHRTSPDYDDLLGEGRVQLIRALTQHDPSRSSDKRAFLVWFVKCRVLDRMRNDRRWSRRSNRPLAERSLSLDLWHESHYEKRGYVDRYREGAGDECYGLVMQACVTDRDRAIVGMRLDGTTNAAIGAYFGVTESRICQILAVIEARYRDPSIAQRRARKPATVT